MSAVVEIAPPIDISDSDKYFRNKMHQSFVDSTIAKLGLIIGFAALGEPSTEVAGVVAVASQLMGIVTVQFGLDRR